jgi:hypothetical protein
LKILSLTGQQECARYCPRRIGVKSLGGRVGAISDHNRFSGLCQPDTWIRYQYFQIVVIIFFSWQVRMVINQHLSDTDLIRQQKRVFLIVDER